MSTQPTNTVIVQTAPSTSGVAIAGLIFSILGWFTCGLLCIPGAFLSFLGLFDRGPKGTAIAGLIVGFPGIFFFVLFGFSIVMGVLGIGSAANEARRQTVEQVAGETEIVQIGTEDAPSEEPDESEKLEIIEAPPNAKGSAESSSSSNEFMTGDELLAKHRRDLRADKEREAQEELTAREEAERLEKERQEAEAAKLQAEEEASFRVWTSTNGKKSPEAKIVSFANGVITLETRNGKRTKVPLEKLIQVDNEYVDKWRKER